MNRGEWGWALFEWARNPYVLLCTIYVLAPYISTVVIGDPVRGQATIAGWHAYAGMAVALTAPFLGAASDRMGRRLPLLAVVTAALGVSVLALWWALPGGRGLPLWALGAAIIVAGVCYAWSELLHNALLTRATTPQTMSAVSGLGLALGNAASVLLLAFVLFAFALPGVVDAPFLPDAPLFGLDPDTHEPSRIAAPIVAVWLAVFVAPMFLYTPDQGSTGERFGDAVRHGFGAVLRTVLKLGDYRNVALFLVARMLYADGKTAILIVSGVYAAGVMDWGLIEMLLYGMLLSVFAVFGGLLAGWLDRAVGGKRAVFIELAVTLICLLAMVSMSERAVFFVIPVEEGAKVWNSPVFATAPELAYLAVGVVIAVSITAAYASSRTLMARLAPAAMQGEIFGLYALAGSATVWMGPMLVAYFTAAYQSQRAGFASVALLLLAGMALLVFVRPPAEGSAKPSLP